jgi:DNA segregation ATPase FtsK/SpoIIIE, S-DNA-T family
MSRRSEIIGKTVGEELVTQLKNGYSTGNFPAIVVVNFRPEEINHIVPCLNEVTLEDEAGPVLVVIAAQAPWPELESQYFLPAGRTSTYYRSRNTSGLVLIEYDLQSDHQGLRNMKSFNDRTLLSGEGKSARGLRMLLETAWEIHSQETKNHLPAGLPDAMVSIYEQLALRRSISLRDWVDFLEQCCIKLNQEDKTWSGDETRRAVGSSLFHLNLFPDPHLLSFHKRQFERRIEFNSHFARLNNSKGRELDEDDLMEAIKTTNFVDENQKKLSDKEAEIIRENAREIVQPTQNRDYSTITLDQWTQIFEKERDESKVGDKVVALLAEQYEDRLEEYENLNIRDGLNAEEQETANEFINTPPAEGTKSIFDLLDSRLKRRIEKIAAPRVTIVSDPLRALLYGIYQYVSSVEEDHSSEQKSLILKIENHRDREGQLSLDLFLWLYKNTLLEIVAETGKSGIGSRLTLGTLITKPFKRLEDIIKTKVGDDDDTDLDKQWKELRFSLTLASEKRVVHRFVWRPEDNPGLIAFVRTIQHAEPAECAAGIEKDGIEAWAEASLDVRETLKGKTVPPGIEGDPTDRWNELRQDTFQQWSEKGLSTSDLKDYLEDWQALLIDLRSDSNYIPHNAPNKSLTSFLKMDTLEGDDGKYALLATHPLRLRWINHHFTAMRDVIKDALEGTLRLNSTNDSFYFDHLEDVSPHTQPPIYCPADGVLAVATKEYGWHEEFALIQKNNTATDDWISAVDDSSVSEIASTVRTYLSSYPHKADGLSLLLLSHDGNSRAIHKLISLIRQREFAEISLEVHIAAPGLTHSNIARDLSELETESDRESALLPTLRIHLHHWTDATTTSDFIEYLKHSIDIAIVPNLFGTDTSVQVNTIGDTDSREGRFDPWTGRTSFNEAAEAGRVSTNVTRTLLPRTLDLMLEAWSTLNVWHYRNSPVSQRPESLDFFTLQVRFDLNQKLFTQLHEIAHWVITLDAFIGRDQIESLDSHPDIITIKPDVGKNDMYTLIVSSSTGRDFVTERLEKKIRDDIKLEMSDPAFTAERLYNLARNATPSLVLRALGLGNTTQEMLGLVTARYSVKERFPVPSDWIFEAWVSLDEHMDWFGGPQLPRADMLRLIGRRNTTDGQLHLTIHVVESKFRAFEDAAHAEVQLTRSVDLLCEALAPKEESGAEQYTDALFWRLELLSALDQGSKKKIPHTEFPPMSFKSPDDTIGTELSPEIREKIRSGNYILECVEGIACTVAYDTKETIEPTTHTPQGHHWIRLAHPDLRKIFSEVSRKEIVDPTDILPLHPNPDDEVKPKPPEPTNGGDTTIKDPDKKPDIVGGDEPPQPSKGLGSDGLKYKYQIVLDALDEFGVNVSRHDTEPYLEGPGFYIVRVVPGHGVRPEAVMDRTDELKLKLQLPAYHTPRTYIDGGAVIFEIPKTDEERYPVSAEELWARTNAQDHQGTLYVPVGEDIRGNVVGINFSSSDSPHLLIAGTTGSGKSIALEALLRGLCHFYPPEDLQLNLVDPKGTELASFEEDPHLMQSIGFDAEDAIGLLNEAVDEMQRRYKILREHKVRDITAYKQAAHDSEDIPWRLVVLDEYADLTSDKDDRKAVEDAVRRLSQKARACGIHVILATQKPSHNVISTIIRSNLTVQLALRVNTSSDSRIIMDANGAETLAGKGDAFLNTAREKIRIQCAMI